MAHHSAAHNTDSPAPGEQQESRQTNRVNSGDSATQQGEAVENEEGEGGSGEKSGPVADNAAQRTGSLSGTLERDRRKVRGDTVTWLV